MALYILPCIGSSGLFKVSPPFNTVIRADEKFTVEGIRTITELESNGLDVKASRYIDNGLTEQDYINDAEINMHIVILKSAYGQWYEVPARYIIAFPKIDGVVYTRRNIVVQMPYIEKEEDLELLIDELKNITKDYIGAEVAVDAVEVSSTLVISEQDHAVKKAQRQLLLERNPSLSAVNRQLTMSNQSLRDKIALLEAYIIQKGI